MFIGTKKWKITGISGSNDLDYPTQGNDNIVKNYNFKNIHKRDFCSKIKNIVPDG